MKFYFSGSDDQMVYVGNLSGCEGSYYEYTIDFNTYGVPDSFCLITPDYRYIYEIPYVPCDYAYLPVYSECRTGFVLCDENGCITTNVIPDDFYFSNPYIPTRNLGRLRLLLPYNYAIFKYIGNKIENYTIAQVYVHPIKEFKVTYSIDTLLYPCEYRPQDIHTECVDTVWNILYMGIDELPSDTVCLGSRYYLPHIPYDHTWIHISDTLHEYVDVFEDMSIDCYIRYPQCTDIVSLNLTVLDETRLSDTTIYLKQNELVPSWIYPVGDQYYMDVAIKNCTLPRKVNMVRASNTTLVYIPNAFSPNGDGYNDVWFVPMNPFIAEIVDVKIFSRYGELVHQGNYWDGSLYPQGTYVYLVKIKDVFGNYSIHSGDINLIR